MNKNEFFNEIKNELCEGKSICDFTAMCAFWAKDTRNGITQCESSSINGQFRFSDDKDCIIIKNLAYPYRPNDDTTFTIVDNNFIYDSEYRTIIMTDIVKHPNSHQFGTVITLRNIKIK